MASLRRRPRQDSLRVQWRQSKVHSSNKDGYLQTAATNIAQIAWQRTRMARRLQGRQGEARWEFRIRESRHRNLAPGERRDSNGTKIQLGSLKPEGSEL